MEQSKKYEKDQREHAIRSLGKLKEMISGMKPLWDEMAKEKMIFRMQTDGRRAAMVLVPLKETPTMNMAIMVCLN